MGLARFVVRGSGPGEGRRFELPLAKTPGGWLHSKVRDRRLRQQGEATRLAALGRLCARCVMRSPLQRAPPRTTPVDRQARERGGFYFFFGSSASVAVGGYPCRRVARATQAASEVVRAGPRGAVAGAYAIMPPRSRAWRTETCFPLVACPNPFGSRASDVERFGCIACRCLRCHALRAVDSAARGRSGSLRMLNDWMTQRWGGRRWDDVRLASAPTAREGKP